MTRIVKGAIKLEPTPTASAPADAAGVIYYDSDDSELKLGSGSGFAAIAGGLGFVGQDQTGGTAGGNTESKIGEVQVAADAVSDRIIVIATGHASLNNNNTATIRLRAGENAAFASNTLYKTIVRDGSSASGFFDVGWTVTYMLDTGDLDFSNLNYIQLTGQNDDTEDIVCESVVVLGV